MRQATIPEVRRTGRKLLRKGYKWVPASHMLCQETLIQFNYTDMWEPFRWVAVDISTTILQVST